jgi:hypothetical protein
MSAVSTHTVLSLFHIFIIAPFLLYVGFTRSSLPRWVYWLLLGLGIVLVLYHGMKAYTKWIQKNPSMWVNVIHALIVGPLLLYIGANQFDTPRPAYELLLMTAFAALGYHFYSLVTMLQTLPSN